jgi:cell division ATPase FtsA
MLSMVFSKLRERLAKETTDEYIVGLDIGTEFVKALIAKVKGDELEIIGVGRTRQAVSDMHSGAISDISGVVRNCEDALAQAEEEAGLQAKRVVIGIAGELVKGVTNTIRYRRPQPDRPLDVPEMELIIEKFKNVHK